MNTTAVPTTRLLHANYRCPTCTWPLIATRTRDGIWVECDCGAGYAGRNLLVIVEDQS